MLVRHPTPANTPLAQRTPGATLSRKWSSLKSVKSIMSESTCFSCLGPVLLSPIRMKAMRICHSASPFSHSFAVHQVICQLHVLVKGFFLFHRSVVKIKHGGSSRKCQCSLEISITWRVPHSQNPLFILHVHWLACSSVQVAALAASALRCILGAATQA